MKNCFVTLVRCETISFEMDFGVECPVYCRSGHICTSCNIYTLPMYHYALRNLMEHFCHGHR